MLIGKGIEDWVYNMYLFDSDVLVDFFNKQKYAINLVTTLSSKNTLFISSPTITEILTGFDNRQAEFFIPKLYDLVSVIYVTTKIAELAGRMRMRYRINGKILPTVDTIIAASAIINNLQLVTRNIKDYPMKELKIYKIPEV